VAKLAESDTADDASRAADEEGTRRASREDMGPEHIYSFGPFQLHLERGCLFESDKPVRLGNRALEILIALVERAGEVVSNQELIARVWPETFVDDSNLRVHLGAIRRRCGTVRTKSTIF